MRQAWEVCLGIEVVEYLAAAVETSLLVVEIEATGQRVENSRMSNCAILGVKCHPYLVRSIVSHVQMIRVIWRRRSFVAAGSIVKQELEVRALEILPVQTCGRFSSRSMLQSSSPFRSRLGCQSILDEVSIAQQ